jgi:hypothetical protein
LKNGVTGSSLQFMAAQPSDRAEVGEFLQAVFKKPQFASRDLLQWHYFTEREDWSGSRSYVLKQGEKILAHGGVDPMTLCTPSRDVSSMQLSDWAAAIGAPGAGVILLQELAKLADTFLIPGGTEQTRSILPEIGFRPCGHRYAYSRVVRPWKHLRAERSPDWKSPLRLARNILPGRGPLASSGGWSSVRIESFGDAELPLLERRPDSRTTRCRRTPRVLNYLLACPVAAVAGFLLLRGTEPHGYYILSRVGNHMCIADLSVNSESMADWQAAYSLAAQTAAADTAVSEVFTAVCTQLGRDALERNHFRLANRRAILLLDRKGLLDGAPPLDLQVLDSDEFYLYGG